MPRQAPEARYAYYRRCQQFRRNGEQCKAPAMKGEHICHRHAELADAERRREEQRRELLARPGVGFESFAALQRMLSELVAALFEGSLDHKVAARLIVDIQHAIRMPKMQKMQKMITVEERARARLARRESLVETKGSQPELPLKREQDLRRGSAETRRSFGRKPANRAAAPTDAKSPVLPSRCLRLRQKAIMVDG